MQPMSVAKEAGVGSVPANCVAVHIAVDECRMLVDDVWASDALVQFLSEMHLSSAEQAKYLVIDGGVTLY